ncbi:hypothetical protein E1B28_003006 [Marasmius oreades]|uniref:ABM domain-containing protein n=1 Tax=Marasmius oreades TaxID=181124 RepID=A0A9P7UK57_9AGAR|nr:uncharacterized protein E1B28_003006 [Marasmius oreades]KAG7085445.1 hypothetical protein E1B28_003006 [Marasmius oreades]
MRFQSLFSFSLSLAAATGVVYGAPSATGANSEDTYGSSQAVTIQHFSLKQPGYGETQQDIIQKLTEAMSKVKASSGKKVEHAYIGVADPDIAEQIFLWKSPPDASTLDTIKPFTSFSSSGTVNSSTSVFNDRTTLLRSLGYPIIESVVLDVLPNVPTTELEQDYSVVVESILQTGSGLGGSHGIQQGSGSRTFMVINGWESQQAVTEWADGVNKDPETAPVYDELLHSFVGGIATPLFKAVKEIP